MFGRERHEDFLVERKGCHWGKAAFGTWNVERRFRSTDHFPGPGKRGNSEIQGGIPEKKRPYDDGPRVENGELLRTGGTVRVGARPRDATLPRRAKRVGGLHRVNRKRNLRTAM